MSDQRHPFSFQSDPKTELFEIQGILENIDRGFMAVDRNWHIDYVNTKAASDVNRKPKDLIGKNFWKEFPELEGTNAAKNYHDAMEKRVAVEIEEYSLLTDRWNQQKAYPTANGIVIAWADITERKKTEEKLRQSEEKYRLIVDTAEEGIWLATTDGKATFVNQKMADMLGYSKEEILGKAGTEFLEKPLPEEVYRNRKILDKHGGIQTECKFIKKDGSILWTFANTVPVFDSQGKHVANIAMHTDITERKQTEKALREAEEKFRSLVESTSDMIWQVDEKAVYTYVSPKIKDILGYEPQEVIGKTPFDLIDEEQEEEIVAAFLEIANKKEPFYGLQNCNVHKNGSRVLLETSGVPILDHKGNLVGYRGIDRDITDRKKAEEDLARSKQRITDILSSIDEYVFSIDKNWNIVYISNKAATVAGVKPQDLVDKCFWEYGKVFVGTLVETSFREAMNKREIKSFEWENKLTNGCTAFTVFPSNEGITVYGEDITERKKLQQELENYTKDLEKLVYERTKQLQDKERLAAIGQTAGMVGHDIRNPLQAIIGDIYIAKEETKSVPDSEAKQSMEETFMAIEENVFYINKIVSDLQDYTRPIVPNRKETNVEHLINTVMESIKVPQKIQTQIDVTPDLTIKSDQDYLRRMLTNLVLNAIQAMPKGGKLGIQANNQENKTIITVEDSGVGMPANVKEKLFTPLFTTKAKGQGLGLAVVKRLVEGLNGNIQIESEEGKGTKFTIELPLK
jgi:PAS domain S-box-containing protein